MIFVTMFTGKKPEEEKVYLEVVEKQKRTLPTYSWLFRAGRIILDAILINLSFIIAYRLRYTDDLAQGFQRSLSDFYSTMFGLTVITLVVLQLKGFYRDTRATRWLDEVLTAGSAVTTSIAIEVILLLIFNQILNSRLLFAYAWGMTLLALSLDRYLSRIIRVRLWQRGFGVRRLLVIGGGKPGQRIMQQVVETPELGYKLVGFVDDDPDALSWTWPVGLNNKPYQDRARGLGTTRDVDRLVREEEIREIIIALPSSQHEQVMTVIEHCHRLGVGFLIVPDIFEMSFNLVHTEELNGIPLIGLRANSIRGFNLFLKRTFDLSLAILGIIVATPLLLVTAILIKLDSPGPIFFHQTRVGKNGRLFKCHKFRSMKVNAEAELAALKEKNETTGPIFKMKNDPRVTRIGRIIRRLSIDEIPQIFNVLTGEMSLVGPRPPLPTEVDAYEEWHKERLEVTPGITGLWQVSGRSWLGFDDMVKLDIYYAENWSLTLDFKIMIRTIPEVMQARGAF